MAEDHETERYERFDELRKLSKEAQSLAYCPYSKFRVGCALLTSDNKIYMGANVENASYGAAICAERVAITRAVMDGHKSFKAIAVAGDTKTPLSPCGICRQFIREFSSDMPVHMFGTEGHKTLTMAELLPMSFGPEALNQ